MVEQGLRINNYSPSLSFLCKVNVNGFVIVSQWLVYR
jgi:hypothetical protein